MSSSRAEFRSPRAVDAKISKRALAVDLADGRTLVIPIAWYPRLLHGTPAERANWRLIGSGQGIHWPDLDEDISIEGLLAGLPSGESPASLKQWLSQREAAGRKALPRPTGAGRVRDQPRPPRRAGHR